MKDHDERLQPVNKPQLTEADKALLEAAPDWERMGEGAKRLLGASSRNREVIAEQHPKEKK